MNDLLTPEQIAGIVNRDKYDCDPIAVSHSDRRALLRDREAIAGRLERYAEDADQNAAGLRADAANDDEHGMAHLAASKKGRAFGYELVAQDIRALITAIRGEKG